MLVRLWPFAAWCLALAAAVWLYFGEAGHGHALAIEDIEELKVSPAVAGRIAKLTAELGQRVRKGDVLATLDARDLEVKLKLAKAETERSRARLAAWLKSDPAAAPDARVLPFEQDLRAQEAKVTELEQEREKYQITAPAEGTVSRIATRVGEWRAAGGEIVDLVIPRADRLTGYVTDRQISAVAVGTLATLRPRDLGGAPLQGRVVTVGPQIEQVPIRLRAIPNVPQWGRRVIFQVVKSGEPLPGEIYEVRFH
jgi:multidrug resistance efflux pump